MEAHGPAGYAQLSVSPRFLGLNCLIALAIAAGRSAAALDWQQQTGYRRAALSIAAGGKTGFIGVNAATAGITFTNRLGEERALTNQVFLNGSGVAAGDVDGDGLCDLYFCGLDSPNALYRNLGDWKFADVTSEAGVACSDQASTGAAFADVDGDGDLDLLVNGIGRGTRLFLNDGKGHFHEATEQAGLAGNSASMSMALADIDGDGLLDLYVVNYRSDTMRDMPDIRFSMAVTNGVFQLLTVNGRLASAHDLVGRFSFDNRGGVLENGEADVLFHNVGNGRFEPVSWTNGAFLGENGEPVRTPYDWGLSAMFRDLNGDGAPDLYVCNDFQSPDRIWINDGHGRFRAIARQAIRQTSLFSMGVDFADIDRDGFDDFFVADMLSRKHPLRQVQVMDSAAFAQVRSTADDRPQFSRNMLFHNRGNGTYAELAQLAGLEASDWSWCPAFLDVDLDGYEDLLVTTGHWRDAQNADIAREIEEAKKQKPMPALEQLRLRKRFPRLDTPNVAFRNRGDLTFEEVGAAWGFDSRRISHGMALADLDNDGDLDVVINCLNDAPLLCRNDSPRPRISVRLRGRAPNTRGVGARVRVLAPGLPAQSQEIICGGRYLSSDDFVRTFAAGNETNRVTIEVTWRDGRQSIITNAPSNHVFELDESAARFSPVTNQPPQITPFFTDVTSLLKHVHHDEPFDDFARQPLLPRKLSQLGPGVTWFDFNGDGWDDLFIGAGRSGRIGVFRNDGHGRFIPQRAAYFDVPVQRDLTTVLGWRPNPTNIVLLMGLANCEDAATNGPGVRQFSVVSGAADDELLRSVASTGPLALADIDGDGDLDLFVGGRVLPGRYPVAASSALLRNDGGRLRFDAQASSAFAGVGLVSGAVFTDLDADGWPELVLACEWGPVRIFRNERGQLVSWDAPVTLNHQPSTINQMTGWWNSVAAGDFDGDGRLDIVAGNWGRNTKYESHISQPLHLHFGDLDDDRYVDLIEAYYDRDLKKIVPWRDWQSLAVTFPFIKERYANFTAFSTAGVSEFLGNRLTQMKDLVANTLDSVVFLNRGDHFDARPLPMDAQWSPVFGIAVGDLDGDGNEDIFVSQNFFAVSSDTSRCDAGCGLWLKGDGRGGFIAVPGQKSGIAIYGEGRGAALCDYDHDGRLDLAVGQNGGATRLYRNAGARPGLRVCLKGTPGNPQGIGAVVQLKYANGRFGSAHEVHAGAGYWSQDSADLVLGTIDEAESLAVKWPGGATMRVHIRKGARNVVVGIDGRVEEEP